MLSWNMPPPPAPVDAKEQGFLESIDEAAGDLLAEEVRAQRERANEEFKRIWKVCELTN
jgi:hypothetical protein